MATWLNQQINVKGLEKQFYISSQLKILHVCTGDTKSLDQCEKKHQKVNKKIIKIKWAQDHIALSWVFVYVGYILKSLLLNSILLCSVVESVLVTDCLYHYKICLGCNSHRKLTCVRQPKFLIMSLYKSYSIYAWKYMNII